MVTTMAAPRFMQSGEAAAALGVSVELLRKYERLGRIAPPLRTARGVRLYTPQDVETIRQVREVLRREREASAA